MRKSPELQQITKSFSWSLPLHGKAEPYFFFRIVAYCTLKCNCLSGEMEEKSVTLSVHGNICRRNTLILKFSAVKPAVWIAHRIAVKDEPKGFIDCHSSSFPEPLSRNRRQNECKKEGAAFPRPEKRPLGVFSTCWLGRTESCQLLHIHFKALLHRCLHRLIVLPMQQAVGCKRGIVILDDLVSIGEEIDMRQEQFCRVVIHPFSELRSHRGCEALPHELIHFQNTRFDPFLQTGAFT